MARVPPKTVTRNDQAALKNLDTELKKVVFGQDKAIEALASSNAVLPVQLHSRRPSDRRK